MEKDCSEKRRSVRIRSKIPINYDESEPDGPLKPINGIKEEKPSNEDPDYNQNTDPPSTIYNKPSEPVYFNSKPGNRRRINYRVDPVVRAKHNESMRNYHRRYFANESADHRERRLARSRELKRLRKQRLELEPERREQLRVMQSMYRRKQKRKKRDEYRAAPEEVKKKIREQRRKERHASLLRQKKRDPEAYRIKMDRLRRVQREKYQRKKRMVRESEEKLSDTEESDDEDEITQGDLSNIKQEQAIEIFDNYDD